MQRDQLPHMDAALMSPPWGTTCWTCEPKLWGGLLTVEGQVTDDGALEGWLCSVELVCRGTTVALLGGGGFGWSQASVSYKYNLCICALLFLPMASVSPRFASAFQHYFQPHLHMLLAWCLRLCAWHTGLLVLDLDMNRAPRMPAQGGLWVSLAFILISISPEACTFHLTRSFQISPSSLFYFKSWWKNLQFPILIAIKCLLPYTPSFTNETQIFYFFQ